MGLLSYRLAQAYSHLGPKYEEKSMEMYKKAEQVLSITHGKDHKLFTEISRKLSALSMCWDWSTYQWNSGSGFPPYPVHVASISLLESPTLYWTTSLGFTRKSGSVMNNLDLLDTWTSISLKKTRINSKLAWKLKRLAHGKSKNAQQNCH